MCLPRDVHLSLARSSYECGAIHTGSRKCGEIVSPRPLRVAQTRQSFRHRHAPAPVTTIARISKAGMESRGEAPIRHWRKMVALGSGRTGSVALFLQQISAEDKTCGENHERIFHAVKRVPRKCMMSSGAVRRIMQEKNALQLLKGVRKIGQF